MAKSGSIASETSDVKRALDLAFQKFVASRESRRCDNKAKSSIASKKSAASQTTDRSGSIANSNAPLDDNSTIGSVFTWHPDKSKIPSALEKTDWVKEPNTLVKFIVGKDKKVFTVHREVACRVRAFRIARETEVIPDEPQTYRLENATEAVFAKMMEFMYTSNIEHKQDSLVWYGWCEDNDLAIKVAKEEFANLVGLWVLADELRYEKLAQKVLYDIKTIIDDHAGFAVGVIMSKDLIDQVYESTSEESDLRGLFVDKIAQHVSPESLKTAYNDLPEALKLDLALLSIKKRGQSSKATKASIPRSSPPLTSYCGTSERKRRLDKSSRDYLSKKSASLSASTSTMSNYGSYKKSSGGSIEKTSEVSAYLRSSCKYCSGSTSPKRHHKEERERKEAKNRKKRKEQEERKEKRCRRPSRSVSTTGSERESSHFWKMRKVK